MLNNKESNKEKKIIVTSLVLPGGTLVETVMQERGSLFAVYEGNTVTYQSTLLIDGQAFAPLPKTNKLVKHGVMHFPRKAEAYESEEKLVEEIAQYIHRYVDISPEFERVTAYYVLLTWVYDAFNECPYLRFQGDFGSGKSRALLVVGALTYKAVFASGASTVSPIFHILDCYRGTLVFDETDFRFSDAKADIVKILNNGNVKGFPVLRTMMSTSKEFEPQAFNVFGPKVVAMRDNFEDEALESRFVTEHMEARAIRKSIPINLDNAYQGEAADLRDKLLMYRFNNWSNVKIDRTLESHSLSLRANQIALPLLSIIDAPEHREEVVGIFAREMDELVERRKVSVESRVAGVLLELIDVAREKPVSLSVLTHRVVADYGHEFTRPLTPRYVGSLLKKLGITTYKTSGVHVISLAEKHAVIAAAKMFGHSLDEHVQT